MRHVFMIGAKGIPGAYGGYETFVDKLTEYHQHEPMIRYHVACKNQEADELEYHNARCFSVKVPDIGPSQAIYYDLAALENCCAYITKKRLKDPIIYILACRIGPFASFYQRKIHRVGGKIFLNPDGHEWMRAKWSGLVRKYWKISERMMVKHADLVICDSQNIEAYIQKEYGRYDPKTTFIPYGAEIKKNALSDDDEAVDGWYRDKDIRPKGYYLVVGRFVPENNLETIIREFMRCRSDKSLVLITTRDDVFFRKLEKKLHFQRDQRIKFVGSVYDQGLLKKIREGAYGYIHGHEVGGTNPSLLEALGSTDLNLLLDVGFNREVGKNAAWYWEKREGSLKRLVERADEMTMDEITALGRQARQRIREGYSWGYIADRYREIFLKE